jgi:hypothetical protein
MSWRQEKRKGRRTGRGRGTERRKEVEAKKEHMKAKYSYEQDPERRRNQWDIGEEEEEG